MRKMKKWLSAFAVCMMTGVMLCSSGCVVIVSERMIDNGIDAVEEAVDQVKEFRMGFYKAGLNYSGTMSGGCIILGRNDEGRYIEIPATMEGTPVTEIKAEAFRLTNIKTVIIGENVRYIGALAFSRCDDLKKVTFVQKVGWKVNGQSIDSSILEDEKKAAELLKQGAVWERT